MSLLPRARKRLRPFPHARSGRRVSAAEPGSRDLQPVFRRREHAARDRRSQRASRRGARVAAHRQRATAMIDDTTEPPRSLRGQHLVVTGYAEAEAITRARAKSFAFASVALDKPTRRAACAVYAFCRRCDDAVDETHP